MKKFEIVLLILFLGYILLRFVGIELSVNVFLFSGLLLGLFYFGFTYLIINNIPINGNKNSTEPVPVLRIIFSGILGLNLSLIANGLLVKFLILPGANEILAAGIYSLAVNAIIFIVTMVNKKDWGSTFFKNAFPRLSIALTIGISAYIYSTENILNVYYHDYPEYIELRVKALSDPDNVELAAQIKEMRKEIEQSK